MSNIASQNLALQGNDLLKLVHSTCTLTPHVLLVEEDAQLRNLFTQVVKDVGLSFDEAADLKDAHSILSQKGVTILLLDTTRAENGEPPLVREMRSCYPDTLIIATSSSATIESAVETMRAGAFDYLSKPFSPDVLGESLVRGIRRARFNTELLRLKKNVDPQSGLADLLGQTVEIEKLYRMLSSVANSTSPVLITGESGTGKGLLAKSIHLNSQHPSSPFISIDCRSLLPSAIEEALFGAVGHPGRLGLLASPKGGTVFLKEVGTLPLQIQARLVKAIRDKEIISSDGNATARLTVRIVAASCENLTEMVFRNLFRRDLHNSLSLVNLAIPPLRSRPDDVLFLAKRFLENLQDHTGVIRTLSDDAQQLLQTYDWPNNMRELERTLAFACAYSNEKQLETADFPDKIICFHKKPTIHNSPTNAIMTQASTLVTIAEMEKQAIQEAVRLTGGDKLRAAAILGIGKTTLYRKLKEYRLSMDDFGIANFRPAEITALYHVSSLQDVAAPERVWSSNSRQA